MRFCISNKQIRMEEGDDWERIPGIGSGLGKEIRNHGARRERRIYGAYIISRIANRILISRK